MARIGLEPVWKGHILAASRLTINWIIGLAQQRYVKSHRNLFRSPRSGPHPGTPYRPIRVTGVGKPGLARDPHELSHDGGFRLFIWRYEVNPLCGPLAFIPVFTGAFYFAFWRLCEIVFSPPVSFAT